MNPNIKDPKKRRKYECITCDFVCFKPSEWWRHCGTDKHKILTDPNMLGSKTKQNSSQFECVCGKTYKHRSTLSTHKKTCTFVPIETNEKQNTINQEETEKDTKREKVIEQTTIASGDVDDTDGEVEDKTLIMRLLKENSEFKEMIIDQNQKLLEYAQKDKIVINNNSNNKQFNLNLFLNETCKDAMNITYFVNSLQIETNELETLGRHGYIRGISNIFIKGLKELDETARPVHCTDKKREILYIKDNNIWEKDQEKEIMKGAIKEIAHKNFKGLPKWKESNPTSDDVSSNKHMEYMQILNQVVTSIDPEDEMGINKIIKSVATEVYINK